LRGFAQRKDFLRRRVGEASIEAHDVIRERSAPRLGEQLAISERSAIDITLSEALPAWNGHADALAPSIKSVPCFPVCLFVFFAVHHQSFKINFGGNVTDNTTYRRPKMCV
jgi:hypothetical protein